MKIKLNIPKSVKRLSRKLFSGKSEQVFKDKKKYGRRVKHSKRDEESSG